MIKTTALIRLHRRPTLTRLVLACLLLFTLAAVASAQSGTSATDGSTPKGMEPGAPAGSYQLSGFDNVNFFNGNLNFNLPLLGIGGRGTAHGGVSLKIEQKWRTIKSVSGPATTWPEPVGWEGLQVGYGPGVLVGRLANGASLGCSAVSSDNSLLRLTFIGSDGTEYELRDTLNGGSPGHTDYTQCETPEATSRGTEFITADGSSATFISDVELFDGYAGAPGQIYPSGYLMMRDGTRYRIENGLVMWSRDRNGNALTYEYSSTKVTKITDSLGRDIDISYGTYSSTSPYSDTITYKGFGNQTRTVRVWHAGMNTALRSDQALQSFHDLFPLNGASTSGYFQPPVVTSVELPDGRTYSFKYNSYGELARVELPTGGAFEYDWDGGLAANSPGLYASVGPGTSQTQVYRRVIERRVLPGGSVAASRMTISKPEENGTNVGYAVVENWEGSTRLTSERHYYYGSAKVDGRRLPTDYEPWKTGREWKTEVYDIQNGTAVLRRVVEQTWQQPVGDNNWPTQAETDDTARPNDPQVTQTVTTLSDTNQVTKQTFAYDLYNNQTDVREYDFGAGAAPLYPTRHIHTDYLTVNNSIDYTRPGGPHLRGLPSAQQVYSVNTSSGAETLVAKSETKYDEGGGYAPIPYSGITVPGWSDPVTTARGQATTTRSWVNTTNSWLETHAQYDQLGNVRSAWDAKGNLTEIDYTDSYSDANNSRHTYALPKTMTSPVPDPTGIYGSTTALVTTNVYDFSTGLLSSTTDANGRTTTLEHNDVLDRLTKINRPDGGWTSYAYDHNTAGDYVHTQTKQNTAGVIEDAYGYFDGLGRAYRSFKYENYETTKPWLTTDTEYDALGRVERASLPYRSTGSGATMFSSGKWTESAYDSLGRATSVTTKPDNAVVTTAYSGNSVTVTDQAGKVRRSRTDALGRLTRVDEPNASGSLGTTSAPVQPTSYTYDALGNLCEVEQGVQTR
ncbi:MAG: RHS repeat domain-containing protein, partial [Pyrinomonadaceae bacterium]